MTATPRATQRPIADYALLSDCHSAALVSRDGSVDWFCVPRFDSATVFARILGDDAGHWTIRPAAAFESTRRYDGDTLVLETTFTTDAGAVVLTDALAVGRNERGHELGADAPHALLRQVRCVEGRVEMLVDYAPRPEYGLVRPSLIRVDGAVHARGGGALLLLSSGTRFDVTGASASARFTIERGDVVAFALQHRSMADGEPRAWSARDVAKRLDDTRAAWASWSEMHQQYDGPWRELVRHSGRVLQGLTYFPTGALVAAPTTSLPEEPGGVRNWDYRYCWIRDASLTLEALWVAACPDEAHHFFNFLAHTALGQIGSDDGLQIMFGVGGEHHLGELELPWLAGWRDSRPVRAGNGAWNQRQQDVYGELLAAAHLLADQLTDLDPAAKRLLVGAADAAATLWKEPDHGIWEFRGEPRHFLHSKLMCWVALDRAIALAERLDAGARVAAWTRERDIIRDAILTDGWNERAGAFSQSFGSDALDASALLMPIVGFLPPSDERVRSTIEAIASRLTDERGLVFRYRSEDGLAGGEGAFLLCTFWLAQAFAMLGDVARARATFSAAAQFVNDVGLLAEEAGRADGELLGNFPQAFSHVGLINAAWAIHIAERRKNEG